MSESYQRDDLARLSHVMDIGEKILGVTDRLNERLTALERAGGIVSPATKNTPGVVIIGDGLSVTEEGRISVDAALPEENAEMLNKYFPTSQQGE